MFRKQIIPQISYEKQIKDLKIIYKHFLYNKVEIKKNKIKINKFFNLYKFSVIYFFIGNFFIQNKLHKTINNVIEIYKNHLKISTPMSNIKENLYKFLYIMKTKNNLNIKNILFLCNFEFYLPKIILNNYYFYFKTLYIYLKNIKIIFNFFNIYILKIIYLLNNNSNLANKSNKNLL